MGNNLQPSVQPLERRVLLTGAVPGLLGGDADGSTRVDLGDFTRLAANFNRGPDATWLDGDFNADGNVDLTDFTILATNFQRQVSSLTYLPRITQPGTYSGYYDKGLEIATGGRVVLTNARVAGTLHVWGFPDLVVSHCLFTDQGTNLALAADEVASADVSNNTAVGGAGFEFSGWRTGGQNGITFNYNTMTDVTGPYEHGRLVVFADMPNLPRSTITGNRVINHLGTTNSEDVISLYRSGGTAATPLVVSRNWVQGSYWLNSPTPDFSGSGIILGDGGGGVGYVDVTGNTVLDTSNVGITIVGGHDTHVHLNRVFAQAGTGLGNLGLSGWNATGDAGWARNTIDFNTVRWQQAGGGLNNVWSPDATAANNTAGGVTAVNDALRATEYAGWLASLGGHKMGV
jgi:hypothetical protein